MSADDVRIAEALEDIAGSLTMITVALDKVIVEAASAAYEHKRVADRLTGFTEFLEDYAKHNFG